MSSLSHTDGADGSSRRAPRTLALRDAGTLIGLVVILLVFALLAPGFISERNLLNILQQSSLNACLALGMTLVIVSGGIDLSVGPTAALSAVISGSLLLAGVPVPLAILAGLMLGALCGLINGVLVAVVGLQPFIVTLGTLSTYRALALIYTGGNPVLGIPADYRAIFNGTVFGIPSPILIVAVVAIVAWVILKKTPLGEYLLAVGGNEEAARASGINVGRIKIGAYLINGAFVGLAGILLMARTNVGAPNAGQGYEFEALTAAIIGGTSFSGGLGTAGGTLAGAFIVGFLNNIMNLTGVDSYLQQVIKGAIIALAVGYDMWAKVNRTRKTLGVAKIPNERKEAKG